MRILIVDGEEQHRVRLGRELEAAGCRVTMAANGLVADALAQESAFDAIATAILMPVMDGLELIRSVRSRDAEIRIVAMLEAPIRYGRDFHRSLSSTAVIFGANAVVGKPASAAALLDAIGGLPQGDTLQTSGA